MNKDCGTGPPLLSTLSEKTRKSNQLQFDSQRRFTATFTTSNGKLMHPIQDTNFNFSLFLFFFSLPLSSISLSLPLKRKSIARRLRREVLNKSWG